jgi:hypothetical protein
MSEEVKKEAAAPETAAPAAAAPAPAPVQKKAAPEAPKSGKNNRPKNCSQCNKTLKRKTWYFRNGKYFCNKRCWKTSTKPKEPKAA